MTTTIDEMTVLLPEPYFPRARKQRRDGAYEVHPAFTADQLREYGAVCRADERERIAQKCPACAVAIRNMEQP